MIETHYSKITLADLFMITYDRFRLAEIELSIIVIDATILLVILVQYCLNVLHLHCGHNSL